MGRKGSADWPRTYVPVLVPIVPVVTVVLVPVVPAIPVDLYLFTVHELLVPYDVLEIL